MCLPTTRPALVSTKTSPFSGRSHPRREISFALRQQLKTDAGNGGENWRPMGSVKCRGVPSARCCQIPSSLNTTRPLSSTIRIKRSIDRIRTLVPPTRVRDALQRSFRSWVKYCIKGQCFIVFRCRTPTITGCPRYSGARAPRVLRVCSPMLAWSGSLFIYHNVAAAPDMAHGAAARQMGPPRSEGEGAQAVMGWSIVRARNAAWWSV